MNWKNVSTNNDVIDLIKIIESLKSKVNDLDEKALLRYELELLCESESIVKN